MIGQCPTTWHPLNGGMVSAHVFVAQDQRAVRKTADREGAVTNGDLLARLHDEFGAHRRGSTLAPLGLHLQRALGIFGSFDKHDRSRAENTVVLVGDMGTGGLDQLVGEWRLDLLEALVVCG